MAIYLSLNADVGMSKMLAISVLPWDICQENECFYFSPCKKAKGPRFEWPVVKKREDGLEKKDEVFFTWRLLFLTDRPPEFTALINWEAFTKISQDYKPG